MHKLTHEEFITRSNAIHSNKYNYELVVYTNLTDMLQIICPVHGQFSQRANNHLYGKGCYRCGREKTGESNSIKYVWTKEDFVNRSIQEHGTQYIYDKVVYKNQLTKVTITCPLHGDFVQSPFDHTRGSGCPRCAKRGRSKGQDAWLDYLGVPNDQFHRNVKVYLSDSSWIRTDGRVGNTVYEYWGDWAHGNPTFYKPTDLNTKYKKTYGELYDHTLKKRDRILLSGFDLVEIWESEWKIQRPKPLVDESIGGR